ncbi:MAG: ROK family protein [Neptuniibacter sp.]
MRIGIDLGGTKIEIIALDDYHTEVYRKRIATPQGDYSGTVSAIATLILNCENDLQQHAMNIGIGIPGAISPVTGLIKNANSTCLIGNTLDQDLQKSLSKPVKIANYADCFALSEAVDGNGKNFKSVFGVILGTGVGGGIVIDKQLIKGPNAISGEWGHNPLPWLTESDHPHRDCYCGKQDCIETYLSGTGFANSFNKLHHSEVTAESIWNQAEKGDELCAQHCDLYIDQLAKALSSVINILDPEIIVLGGGVSNQTSIYPEVQKRLGKYVFSDQVSTPIVKAKYGDSSGVRGAAWL